VQKAIPATGQDLAATDAIERAITAYQTQHRLILGDSRHMDDIEDESVHLVVLHHLLDLRSIPSRRGNWPYW